jgi:sigma-E factor negative regulatory protein RseC
VITETGQVLEIEGSHAWVACRRQVECARCARGEGCGGGIIGKMLGDRLHRVRAATGGILVAPGDRVRIGLDEGAVMRAAFVVYLAPLAAAVVAAALAWSLVGGDAAAALGAMAGLGGGLVWARRYSRGHEHDPRFQPVVLERVAGERCGEAG